MFWAIVTLMVLSAIGFSLYPLLMSQSEAVTLQSSRMMSGVLIVLIPLTVISMYFHLGNPDAVINITTPAFVATNQSNDSVAENKTVADVSTLFERLKQRLEKQPDDGAGWKMMGLSYLHFKQYDQALKAYEKAAVLLPEDQTIEQAIQRVKSEMAASAQPDVVLTSPEGQQVNVSAMVERLENKLEANPDNLAGWMMLGRSYTHLGQHKKAVSAYQNALNLQPDNQQIVTALTSAERAASKM